MASPDDVELVRIALWPTGIFGEETGLVLLRRLGAALERVSEALSAAAIGVAPDISTLNSGSEVVTAQVFTGFGAAVPDLGRLLDLALRHHVDALRQLFEASGAGTGGRSWPQLGVGFADLSGFTSTTLSLDLDQLGAMVLAFETRAAEVVGGHGGRVVKFVGDAALFVSSDPEALAEMAVDLVQAEASGEAMPVRVGLTFGTVLARDGDHFGPTVNLAARLVDVAGRHEGVTDDGLRSVLKPDLWITDARPATELRGIPEPVVPYRLTRA